MKKTFFKVLINQHDIHICLDVPALETRLFQLVYDCLASGVSLTILDIHDKDLKDDLDNLSYGD